MFDIIRAGRWRYAPREVFHPEPVTLPEDHPCQGCPVLSLEAGKPYCFLPKCRRELFCSAEQNKVFNHPHAPSAYEVSEEEPLYEENPKATDPGTLA